MFLKRVLVSIFELGLSTVLVAVVIYLTYRFSVRANPDFDMEDEIKKGNIAVGILVAAILAGACIIMQKGLSSVASLFRVYATAPVAQELAKWQLTLIAVGHLVMAFVLAMVTISATLRLFGKLTRRIREGEELKKGNIAVGVLLATVVVVASFYVSEGVSAVSRALLPQPSFGRVQVQR